jgi:diguanylate cyclase (GGDEF)-like protein
VVLDSASLQRVNGRGNSAAAVLASAALLVSVLRSGLSLAEQRRLRAAAFGDPLTGLLNYSGFHTLVENEIQRAQRSDAKFCVLTYKLDGLKRLNELRGHREGDRELRRLADAIRSSIRSTDIPARIAGADFAVVFPATSRAGALAAAERLKRLVAVLDEPVNVTVGVAEWPMDGPGKERLLRRADIALYEFNQPQPGKQPTIELTPLANETGDSNPDSNPDSSPSDDDKSALLPGPGRDGSGL